MGGYATNPDTNATSEITGSGTANYMAKFTAAQVIGNSTVQDDGTTVSTTSLFRVGNPAAPGGSLSQMRVGKGTAVIDFGEVAAGQAGIWLDQATPSNTNWSIARNGTELLLNGGSASSVYIALNGVSYYQFTRSTFVTTQLASSSGAVTNFTFTGSANTGQTASTEINRFLLTTSSRQWSTGAITTQREVYITSPTYSFVGASTITSAYTLYVEAPTAGTNATISSNYALGLSGNMAFVGGNASIIGSNAVTIQSSSGSNIILNAGSVTSGGVNIAGQGTQRMFIYTSSASTGAQNFVTYSPASNTGQTASTEINGFLYNSYTRTWAAGAITTQREQYIKTVTYAFASASTITNAYGLYVEAPTAGSNATITNNYALGLSGSLELSGSVIGTTSLILNASNGNVNIRSYNNTIIAANTNNISFTPILRSSGANSIFIFAPPANTGQTASSEVVGFDYNPGLTTQQWATGPITNQREVYFRTRSYTAVGASTITNAYGMYVEAPTASTNITITNNYALGLSGDLSLLGGNRLIRGSNAITLDCGSGSGINMFVNGSSYFAITANNLTVGDATNFVFNTTTGTKIGTATTQKIGFWNATPIVQPTTAVTAATFVANTSGIVNDTATFDGYTIGQVVKALRNEGLLA